MDTVYITLPDFENELRVTGTYYAGSPGSMYRRNGDPGDPPEPEEFYVDRVYDGDTEVTDSVDFEEVEEACIEKMHEIDTSMDEPDYDY